MKKRVLIGLLPFLFMACSKEVDNVECIRGKIVYKGLSCHQKWGVQILDGPMIGEQYDTYDNVIEVYNIPAKPMEGDIIDFKIRDTKEKDFEAFNNCHTLEAVLDVSNVKKAFVSFCD